MIYGNQSRTADRITRSRPTATQWQAERARGPILPMASERTSLFARIFRRGAHG